MVGGVAEINGSQQLPRPAVLVPCACVSAAQAETLRYRCSLCAVTLHRGANRLQKMTETSVKASIFSAPVSVWLPFAATFHVTQASGVAGKRRGEQRATICVSTAFLCKPTAGEPFCFTPSVQSHRHALCSCVWNIHTLAQRPARSKIHLHWARASSSSCCCHFFPFMLPHQDAYPLSESIPWSVRV